jgi:hypothetical protein
MSRSELDVRRTPGLLAAFQGGGAAKKVAAIQEAAFIERAHDAALRDLTALRLADIGHTTRQGIAEAADIVGCLTAHAETNPLAAQAASRLGETGIQGLDRELRHFTKGRRS